MAQKRFWNAQKGTSSNRKKTSLEYQRFEDRNLLAADLGFGPEAIQASVQSVADFAKEPDRSVRSELLASNETASLQKGLNNLVEVASAINSGQTTTVLQQTWNGLPVYGAFVTVVQNEAGEITNYRDQTISNIRGYASGDSMISASDAIAAATRGLTKPTLMESTAHTAWYHAGNKARMAWVVETTVSNPQGEVVDELETWVSVFDDGIFTRDGLGETVSGLLNDPVESTSAHAWVTINDAIGAAGSQALAAPFDSVVQISVGCTGTLIAPGTILSARHCNIGPGASINFGDDSNNPDFVYTVASTINPAGPGTLLDGGDVSIHTLTENVPASVATPMRLTDMTNDLVGGVGMWIGYGANGLGSTGSGVTADGLRWAAENVIDAYGQAAVINTGANIFTSDFDDGTAANSSTGDVAPLVLEGMGGPGDSGGPMLVNVNGEWVVGAVVSGGTTRTSEYGTVGWWTGISIYKDIIEANGGEFVTEAASVGFNRSEYFVGDTINILILDPNATGQISVTVTSDTGDTETVTASPVSPGRYELSLESANANTVFNDGILQVSVGDQIDMTYIDSDDGDGNQVTFNDTATIKAVTESDLIGADFDLNGLSPINWLPVPGGSNASYSDLENEQGDATPVNLTVNGTWSALDVTIDANTIPLHPNSINNIGGQIQTSGQSIELVYTDLVASTDYLIYVMAAEGIFDSIQQTVSIQGLGSAVVFDQRFNQGELFVNDQVGDINRGLEEYAQLITSDINGQISITVDPIAGTQDVVLAGVAIVPDTTGIDAVTDHATTGEDQSTVINVTANDIETGGQPITLQSVSAPITGTASINANGTIDYAPSNNFVGTDTFTYVISDSDGNTSTGAVFVDVTAINDAPIGVFLTPPSIFEDINTANDVSVGTLTGVDVDDTIHTFELVDGTGGTDNDLFTISGDTLILTAGANVDFDVKPQYSIRVRVSDGELSVERVLTIDVIEVNPAVVASLNGTDDQRSMVREAVVSFDDIVTLGAGAFELIKRGPDGGPVTVTPTIDNSSGRSVVTLTFSGAFVTGAGSLEDGNYQLTVFGDQILTSTGEAVDADGDGTAGGNAVFGDTEGDRFFRQFGDVDGDRIVTSLDLLRFRQTWLEDSSDSSFDDRFDSDANGVISHLDLLFFRNNYLDRLDFS